jgi:PAS domain S-box-containing protein
MRSTTHRERSPSANPSSWPIDLLRALTLGALYVVSARLALSLASVHASITPVWPPTGIAIASLLLGGLRLWPGVFVGALIANVLTSGSMASSLGIAAGNTLEALAGAWLVGRWGGGEDSFDRPRDVAVFVILAALAATTLSATVGVMTLWGLGEAGAAGLGPMWLTWWLGDAGGALLVAPVLLLWGRDPKPDWDRRARLEWASLLGSLLAVLFLVFGGRLRNAVGNPAIAFLTVPMLLWAALRFGPRETATAMVVLAAGAIWGTLSGTGPFVKEDRNASLLLLQLFMGVLSVMTLVLAAVVRERERARLELRESEARTQLILDTALDGVITLDDSGKIADWNPQAEKIFGWARAEAVGRPFVELALPPDSRERHLQGLARYLESRDAAYLNRRIEVLALRRDGHRFASELSVVPMTMGGKIFFSTFVRDISARKQAEKLLENHLIEIERLNASLLERKSELSTYHSLVTHDVSNFCATLQAVLERMLLEVDGTLTPKQEELLRRANRQSFELNRLAENAKLLSRLREKGLPPAQDPVSVERTIHRAVELVRSVHFDRSFRVEVECSGELSVTGVPFVESIFLNIIDNAVRYSPRSREPFIRIESVAANGNVRVRIRGGSAVDNELLSSVFDRYVRGPHSTGTGLGLAVIREIVERSGGKVSARNVEAGDEGVFEITLELPQD